MSGGGSNAPPTEENDFFVLVFSRTDFQSHLRFLIVPSVACSGSACRYTPTVEEWRTVLEGAEGGARYRWFVAARFTPADPDIPEGSFWFSNVLSFTVANIRVRIEWNPVGADADLHISPPSGNDIAFFNPDPGWGFLNQDCITTCGSEEITVLCTPEPGNYRVFVQYFDDHGRGPASGTATIFRGDAVFMTRSFSLGATGASHTIFEADQPRGCPEGITAVGPTSIPRKVAPGP